MYQTNTTGCYIRPIRISSRVCECSLCVVIRRGHAVTTYYRLLTCQSKYVWVQSFLYCTDATSTANTITSNGTSAAVTTNCRREACVIVAVNHLLTQITSPVYLSLRTAVVKLVSSSPSTIYSGRSHHQCICHYELPS